MINRIKDIIKNQLRKRRLYVEKSTSVKDVVSLIKKMHPVQTSIPLIRLGSSKDGGYLVPDDLKNIAACFSPGVGRMSDFEMACLSKGMKLFLADKSVDHPGIEEPQLKFLKKYVGPFTNEDYITLDDWVKDSIKENKEDLMLQMDIEGFEYACILNMSEQLLKQYRIIVIEFHNLHKMWNKEFFKIVELTFLKLISYHNCVHIHPNNIKKPYELYGVAIPPVMEITFLRKDRGEVLGYSKEYPNPLDEDNTNNEHVKLPELWYRQ